MFFTFFYCWKWVSLRRCLTPHNWFQNIFLEKKMVCCFFHAIFYTVIILLKKKIWKKCLKCLKQWVKIMWWPDAAIQDNLSYIHRTSWNFRPMKNTRKWKKSWKKTVIRAGWFGGGYLLKILSFIYLLQITQPIFANAIQRGKERKSVSSTKYGVLQRRNIYLWLFWWLGYVNVNVAPVIGQMN